jgi:ACS family glucarate transporter-like MFS transporter
MKQHHRVLAMLAALSIITYLDRVCIAVAGPAMQDGLGISPRAWGWVTGVFFLAYGAFEIPTGVLGDRIGPRRVLTRIVLWWSVFTSLTGFVSSYRLLLLVRFCFGMGEAGAYPNASTVIARWIPGQHRIWATVWYIWFRDFPEQKAGITEAEIREIGAGQAAPHGAVPWREALQSPSLWQLTAISVSYVYALGFYQGWLQTYLARAHGFTAAGLMLSSFVYVIGACANGLGGVTSDWLVRRFGLRAGRRAVGVVGLSSAAMFMLATVVTTSGVWALVFLSLAYAGIMAQQPCLCALTLDTGKRHAGAVFGFGNTASQAASFVSAVAFGYIAEQFGSYNAPFVPMVATLSFGAWMWLQVDPERQIFGTPDVFSTPTAVADAQPV